MDEIKPRFAELSDLPEIVAIYNSTIASRKVTADTEPQTIQSKLNWFAAHNQDLRPLWVFETQESINSNNKKEIVGWLSFSDFYGRPAYQETAEVSIYLNEKYRGLGMGHEILKFAISEANVFGINTLLGFIFRHNDASCKLFEKLGFQQWGHLPQVAVLDGIGRDLLIYGLRLSHPDQRLM